MSELECKNAGFESRLQDDVLVLRLKSQAINILSDLETISSYQQVLKLADASPAVRGFILIKDPSWDSQAAMEQLSRFFDADDRRVAKHRHAKGLRHDIMIARFRYTIGNSMLSLLNFSKPLVAGLHGTISAEYLGTTLTFDARIATADTVISFDNRSTGFPPSPGITCLMPHYIGAGRTMDFVNQSVTLTATEALALGLISKISDGTMDLNTTCTDFLGTLMQRDPELVTMIRRQVLPSVDEVNAELNRYYEAMSRAIIARRQ